MVLSWRPPVGRRDELRLRRRGDCRVKNHLLSAVGTHAGQVTLESMAFVHLKAVSPEILRKCHLATIESLSRTFPRAQLQTFSLHTDGRRNDPPAILHRASACDLVVDILASRVDVLRGHRPDKRRNQETADC